MPIRLPVIARFIAASATLHALVLGAIGIHAGSSEHYWGAPISVKLNASVANPTSGADRSSSQSARIAMTSLGDATDRVTIVTTVPTPVAHHVSAGGDFEAIGPASTQQREGTTVDGNKQDSPENHLLGQINTQLSRYLIYPALARQRGWQGIVVLGFRIESDGQLERIHVTRSSGYEVLDRTAVEALARVGRLNDTGSLNGHGLSTQLPIIYRLLDN